MLSATYYSVIFSFYDLLPTSIYKIVDRVSENSNSFIMACMTPIVNIHSPNPQWWILVLILICTIFCDILLLLLLLLYFYMF